MNMTLSKRGDYVMRSAIALARAYEGGQPRKIREVVADTEVPRTFASQILADLVRAGLAVSRAGREGGYRLTRPPSDISVLEVVEAAEGPLRAERCALGDGPCRWEDVCPLHETWTQATAGLAGLLAQTSLADVAARDADIEAGRYAVPADAHRSHPRTVALSDAVHVELPAPSVHELLAAPRDWGPVLAAAVHEGPEGAAPAPPPLVADCSLDPLDDAPAASGHYLLAWRLAGPGDRSHFEGELHVAALDAQRSELTVSGTWHQETDGGSDGADGSDGSDGALEGAARRVLRGVLRRIARAVDEGPPPVGPTARARRHAPAPR